MPSISFWEQTTFFKKKDLIVIGAGLVGLSAALSYKKAKPNHDVLVIDRELYPKGASSRNAGFACFGSMTELVADQKLMGQSAMLALVERRARGLQKLRATLGDEHIDYLPYGGFEVFDANQQSVFNDMQAQMNTMNELLADVVGHPHVFAIHPDPRALGLQPNVLVIQNKEEGQLHTGKMLKRLLDLCKNAGIEIQRGLTLEAWVEESKAMRLEFKEGLVLKSEQLLIATNGFTKRLMPALEIAPARNQVLITEPIPGLKLKGTFHAEEGYLYFRNVANRVLIGGGRHWNFESSQTDAYDNEPALLEQLMNYMQQMVDFGETKPVMDMTWSGILGVGEEKTPILSRMNQRLVTAVRLGGMGVAIGMGLGEQAAELLLDK